jgi:hypothetical protein
MPIEGLEFGILRANANAILLVLCHCQLALIQSSNFNRPLIMQPRIAKQQWIIGIGIL